MMKQNIRLLFTDLDGTLLMDDHKTVSRRNHEALLALKRAGVKLCACTGRVRCLLPEAVKEIGFDYAITSNGASCVDLNTGEDIFSAYISAERAALAWRYTKPLDALVEWYVDGEILMDRKNYNMWPDRLRPLWHRNYLGAGRGIIYEDIEEFFSQGAPKLEKLNLCDKPVDVKEKLIDPLLSTGLFEISSSLGRNLEITDICADKGRALISLCEHLGIPTGQTIAFGDGGNDVQLLHAAGIGVSMGNAVPEAGAAAKHATLSNQMDGVAAYLEEHVLADAAYAR